MAVYVRGSNGKLSRFSQTWLDHSKLSQSFPSESLWRHTSSRSRNTPRKSSLSSSTNSSIRPIIETGSFLDQILNRLDDSTPNTNLWYKLPNKIKCKTLVIRFEFDFHHYYFSHTIEPLIPQKSSSRSITRFVSFQWAIRHFYFSTRRQEYGWISHTKFQFSTMEDVYNSQRTQLHKTQM